MICDQFVTVADRPAAIALVCQIGHEKAAPGGGQFFGMSDAEAAD